MSESWTDAAAVGDVPEGDVIGVKVAGRDIALYNIGAFESMLQGTLVAGRDVTLLATGITLAHTGRIAAGRDIGLGFVGDNSDRWSAFRNDGLIDAGASLTFVTFTVTFCVSSRLPASVAVTVMLNGPGALSKFGAARKDSASGRMSRGRSASAGSASSITLSR